MVRKRGGGKRSLATCPTTTGSQDPNQRRPCATFWHMPRLVNVEFCDARPALTDSLG